MELGTVHFLYRHQVTPTEPEVSSVLENSHTIISEHSVCSKQQVKFVLEPNSTHPETFPDTFELSNVEQNKFAADSCALSFDEDECISDFEKRKIDKFEKNNRVQSQFILSGITQARRQDQISAM